MLKYSLLSATPAVRGIRMTSSKLHNARRWATAGPRAWGLAVLALVLASLIRGALHPILGAASPGFVFCMASALIAYYYGLAPALFVMVAGLAIADDLFVPPYGSISTLDRNDLTLVMTYPVLTLLIIILIERLHRSQYRSDLIAAVAQSRYEMLLRADNERLLADRRADETHRLLRSLTQRHGQLIFIQALPPGQSPLDVGGQESTPSGADATESALDHASSDTATRKRLLLQNQAIQAGSRFDDVHPEDIDRVLAVPTPGHHRVRLRSGPDNYALSDTVCERFATPTGDFLILRLDA